MNVLLRLFGIREERPLVVKPCPYCGQEMYRGSKPWNYQDPVDAYLQGASVEWLEREIERRLRLDA